MHNQNHKRKVPERVVDQKINYLDMTLSGIEDNAPLLVKWDFPEDTPPFELNISFENQQSGRKLKHLHVNGHEKAMRCDSGLETGDYLVRVSSIRPFYLRSIPRVIHVEKEELAGRMDHFPAAESPVGEIKIQDPIRFSWSCRSQEERTGFLLRVFSVKEDKRLLFMRIAADQTAEEISSDLLSQTGEHHFYWVVTSVCGNRQFESQPFFFHIEDPPGDRASAIPDKRETVIHLKNLGIKFDRVISGKEKVLGNSLTSIFSKRRKKTEFWALKGISFSLKKGDILGVIGRNGAGKSTLLKLLIQVLMPDEGGLQINGRISSLINLGTGFLGDLSGRENIYLNGMYMGMTQDELNAAYDDIVAFSELEEFIDTPIKYYSSGMKARLGFSVAMHTKPDILVIDEVLGAGDRRFRAKAESKMLEFMTHAKAIIIVSHSIPILERICNRCLWLENGGIHGIGPAKEILEQYMNFESQ